MKKAVLTRTHCDDSGTFGVLSIWKLLFFTGELPYRSNQENFSCIPPGVYNCVWDFSPKFGRNTYLLKNVWKRTDIRIHPANFMGDKNRGYFCEMDGCIALGKIIGKMNGQKALMRSRDALSSFETYLAGEEFILEIRDEIKQPPRI